jgi:CxxC-x17-CxxC domain-containing protein
MKFSFKKGTPQRKDRAEKKPRHDKRRSARPQRGLGYNKYPRRDEAPRREQHAVTCPNCGEGFNVTPKSRPSFDSRPPRRDFSEKRDYRKRDSEDRPSFGDRPRRDSDNKPFRKQEGRRDFSSKPSQRRQPRTQTFSTINCADCGRASEVPFKPTSNKPVYCDKCFKKRR